MHITPRQWPQPLQNRYPRILCTVCTHPSYHPVPFDCHIWISLCRHFCSWAMTDPWDSGNKGLRLPVHLHYQQSTNILTEKMTHIPVKRLFWQKRVLNYWNMVEQNQPSMYAKRTGTWSNMLLRHVINLVLFCSTYYWFYYSKFNFYILFLYVFKC